MANKRKRILAVLKAEGDRVGILTHHGAKYSLEEVAPPPTGPETHHGFSFVKIATHHGARLTLPSGVSSVSVSRDSNGNLILRFDE